MAACGVLKRNVATSLLQSVSLLLCTAKACRLYSKVMHRYCPCRLPHCKVNLTFSAAAGVFLRICIAMQVPMPYAANLEAAALPKPDDVVRVAKRMLGK